TMPSTSSVFETSPSSTSALHPVASTAVAIGPTSCGSPLYQQSATSAPASANICAVAAPIPDAAPVTSATFPSRLNMCRGSLTAPRAGRACVRAATCPFGTGPRDCHRVLSRGEGGNGTKGAALHETVCPRRHSFVRGAPAGRDHNSVTVTGSCPEERGETA